MIPDRDYLEAVVADLLDYLDYLWYISHSI